ncbi:MAG TPA: hypothetical protein VM221_09695 [Armatimonadota bacterium]|nr:hypothetical protein [Armatimonadota bacterium]
MRSVFRRVSAAMALALLAAAGAAGQPASGISTLSFSWEMLPGPSPAAAVNLNGARLMTMRGGGWASVNAAKAAAETLQAAAMQGLGAGAVYAEQTRGGYAVIVGEQRLVLVDSAVAAAMESSRQALAEQWAQRVRAVLAGPYLSAAAAEQVVPVGERRAVAVRGVWQQLRVIADGRTAQADYDPAARAVSLLGLAPGEVSVVLDAGAAQLILRVQVMKYAGRVAPTAQAVVTGRLAPQWVMKRAASAAIYQSIIPEPGAWANISDVSADRPSLAPGESASVTVAVTLSGAGYLPLRATPRVRVVNQDLPSAEASVLMVSNRPERLPSPGLWYEGRVPAGHPARLLYHHVNATSAGAELAVELVNTTERPLRVQIVEASGGPSNDEIFVGHRAARDFLARQHDDVGYVVTLPEGAAYTVSATPIKPGQVVSGLAEVRVLDEGELRLRVRLRPPSADLVAPIDAPPERVSRWVFSEPHKRITATYRVGQQWAFATIGSRQAISSTGLEILDGDYGVFYDVTFEVENPTVSTAQVELGLMPGGGLARGVVMIAGRIYETGLLRYGETQRLYEFPVPAGARRELRVRIMPQAGSNYPVKLVLRPRGVWE